jgi:hypothetical protein
MNLLIVATLAAGLAASERGQPKPPAVEPTPREVLPGVQTRESAIIPAMRLQCTLRLDDGGEVHVVLQRGQGHTERIAGDLMHRPLAVSVIEDRASLFADYLLHAWGTDSVFGRAARPGARLGESFQMLISPTGQGLERDADGRFGVTLNEHRAPHYGMRALVRALGFCDGTTSGRAAARRRR